MNLTQRPDSNHMRSLVILLEHRSSDVRRWAAWAIYRTAPKQIYPKMALLFRERLKVDISQRVRRALFAGGALMDKEVQRFFTTSVLGELDLDISYLLQGGVLKQRRFDEKIPIPSSILNIAFESAEVSKWLLPLADQLSPPQKIPVAWLGASMTDYSFGRLIWKYLSDEQRLSLVEARPKFWREVLLWAGLAESLSSPVLLKLAPDSRVKGALVLIWISQLGGMTYETVNQSLIELGQNHPTPNVRRRAWSYLAEHHNNLEWFDKAGLEPSMRGAELAAVLKERRLLKYTQEQWATYLGGENISESELLEVLNLAYSRKLNQKWAVDLAATMAGSSDDGVFRKSLGILSHSDEKAVTDQILRLFKRNTAIGKEYRRYEVIKVLSKRSVELPRWLLRLAAEDRFPGISDWAHRYYQEKGWRIAKPTAFSRHTKTGGDVPVFRSVFAIKTDRGTIRVRLFPEARSLGRLFDKENNVSPLSGKSVIRDRGSFAYILSVYEPLDFEPWTYRLASEGQMVGAFSGCPSNCWIKEISFVGRENLYRKNLIPLGEVYSGFEVLQQGHEELKIKDISVESLVRVY